MKCKYIVEYEGCKYWLDEDCEYYDEETGECLYPALSIRPIFASEEDEV